MVGVLKRAHKPRLLLPMCCAMTHMELRSAALVYVPNCFQDMSFSATGAKEQKKERPRLAHTSFMAVKRMHPRLRPSGSVPSPRRINTNVPVRIRSAHFLFPSRAAASAITERVPGTRKSSEPLRSVACTTAKPRNDHSQKGDPGNSATHL